MGCSGGRCQYAFSKISRGSITFHPSIQQRWGGPDACSRGCVRSTEAARAWLSRYQTTLGPSRSSQGYRGSPCSARCDRESYRPHGRLQPGTNGTRGDSTWTRTSRSEYLLVRGTNLSFQRVWLRADFPQPNHAYSTG